MFTGIIEEVGSVAAIDAGGGSTRLVIAAPGIASDVRESDSVCVNGVCLTVVERVGERLAFDAVPETLRRSTLSELRSGSRVNLERAVPLGHRLGGHLVQGHVDATAVLSDVRVAGDSHEMTFETDARLAPLLVEKGSVALDGISLTLAAVSGARFQVAIIPYTWEQTNLRDRKPGDHVNVETDMIARQIVHALEVYMAAGAGSGRAPAG